MLSSTSRATAPISIASTPSAIISPAPAPTIPAPGLALHPAHQAGLPAHVADRIDVGGRRSPLPVHLDIPAVVQADAGPVEAEAGGVRPPADRDQHPVEHQLRRHVLPLQGRDDP